MDQGCKPISGQRIDGLFRHPACLRQSPFQFFAVALFSHGGIPVNIRQGSARIVHLKLDFRLVIEPGYLAVTLPKLNVVAVSKLFRLFHSHGIVGALERNRAVEMAI